MLPKCSGFGSFLRDSVRPPLIATEEVRENDEGFAICISRAALVVLIGNGLEDFRS